jgi:hypothetical protein
MTDSTIFKEDLGNCLQDHEGVEVDAGYNGHDALKNKFLFPTPKRHKNQQYVLDTRL